MNHVTIVPIYVNVVFVNHAEIVRNVLIVPVALIVINVVKIALGAKIVLNAIIVKLV